MSFSRPARLSRALGFRPIAFAAAAVVLFAGPLGGSSWTPARAQVEQTEPETSPQAAEAAVESRVVAARVYPSGATVTRIARFDAPAGRLTVRVEDLPIRMDPQTLRVTLRGGDGAQLLSMSYRRPQAQGDAAANPERAAIETEIRDVEWARRSAQDSASAAAARLRFVDAFRDRALTEAGEGGAAALIDRLDAWPGAFMRLEEERAAAAADARVAERLVQDLDRRLVELRARLADAAPSAPQGVLIAQLRTDAALVGAELEISYLVTEAQWRPIYDLRLTEPEEGPARLDIVRRAAVSQNTGEDWTAVRLTLSTARPTGRMEAPQSPQLLARIRPEQRVVGQSGGLSGAFNLTAPMTEDAESTVGRLERGRIGDSLGASAPPPEAVVSLEGAAVSFTAPDAATLPSDGETAQIYLAAEEYEVALEARASPAVTLDAFLTGLVTLGQAPILPGRASIFRDEAFVGAAQLGLSPAGAQAALPLGPADEIRVTRRTLDVREGEEGVFRTENRRRAQYEITVRNVGGVARRVSIADSAPYTEAQAIEITATFDPQPTRTALEGRRGVVSWTFDLEPGDETTLAHGYEMTWPEGQQIDLISR